ncbi:uncharacterized protein LOC103518980 isoform X2 [Diaphorina citri]|uniref:Uncharacterized protein LOC103518980 isoform X2 n=1 Tax=Diaphorina citri TaxID=121845 RepID=A0A3Q0JI79_DIACI|nr:uncharacterized protein LOC103518980 isoform X2 [Diaphorina citri]
MIARARAFRCSEKQRCATCNRKHHLLIHMDQKTFQAYQVVGDPDFNFLDNEDPLDESSVNINIAHAQVNKANSFSTVSSSQTAVKNSMVLLPTAIIYIKNSDEKSVPARALLDAGSQVNLISDSYVKKLGLKSHNLDIKLCGIGESSVNASKIVDIAIHTIKGDFNRKLKAIVLPQICSHMPAQSINVDEHKYLLQYELADPNFFESSSIDIILGAEIFYDLLKTGRVANFPGRPALQNTVFGWVVAGRLPTYCEKKDINFKCMHVTSDPLIKFWEIEELPNTKNHSAEERECEQFFQETTYRDEEGKYVVRIPFKENLKDLGTSKKQALHRYNALEKKLSRDDYLKTNYNLFLNEYLDLEHMEEVKSQNHSTVDRPPEEGEFFLPHHAIVRAESSTTKLRVVFDGSMKTSTGLSLNETMKVGPTLQDDLLSILLRFRLYKIALIADVEKMYRQIWVHEDDRKYQKIWWRQNEDSDIACFQLKTVTYGTSCAPYLAVKCLKQLAQDEKEIFPNASKIADRDFYVDDLISSTESEEKALELYKELTAMFQKAGFRLRKWISNSKYVLNEIPVEDRAVQVNSILNHQETVKALGLRFNPSNDEFSYSFELNDVQAPTKRIILSEIGKLFDPLGLISPIIINAKIFLQELWLLSYNWDDKLDDKTSSIWKKILNDMNGINKLKIDRYVFVTSSSNVEFHGFCDASEKAYAACLYVKCKNGINETNVKLLCAKTRVAPVKQISLARLELCAALLLANLIRKVKEALSEHDNLLQWHAWTDSQIVLAWISKLPCKWKTFVANRVAAIQEVLSPDRWKYVKSEENPADLASRGCSSVELNNTNLWWNGPSYLINDDHKQNPLVTELHDVPEARKPRITSMVISCELDIFDKYSSFSKLIRVTALCLRFISNIGHSKRARVTGYITKEELSKAEECLIKIVQRENFAQDLNKLKDGNPLSPKSKLKSLNPFIDQSGIMRVGGRLEKANIEFDKKHQVILPKNHNFTKLLIIDEHEKNVHAGQQVMINHLRQRYWILNSRSLIRQLLHKCLKCFKAKLSPQQTSHQIMGSLPKERVTPGKPFLRSGVDLCGPFQIKRLGGRANTTWKAYVVLFICFSTKAVHIEIASDLSSKTFLAALKRFTARRGLPLEIFSDNGTNFVGANNELKNLGSSTAMIGIKWHFIPANSPHFGGLWEANIKSFKRHFKASIGNQTLTYEELLTISTQIEACLNSRPLVPMCPDDPDNLDALTPAHFLVGGQLLAVPENLLPADLNINRLTRWKLVEKIHQTFWKRWSTEYLHQLQQRNKWMFQKNNVKINDMVLIKEEHVHPLQWAMGRVTQVFPGSDGNVRAVEVTTSNGTLRRSVVRLALLPINDCSN